MTEYQFHWQTWVGISLLLLLLASICLPELSISGDKYIDAAVEANQYALNRNSDLSDARKIVEEYKAGGDRRSAAGKDYEKQINENAHGHSISRLFFARWALNVRENLDFEGIQLQEGKSLRTTKLRLVLHLWGWLIYIPFLMTLVSIVFMLARRRTFSALLLIDGWMTIICEAVIYFMIPSMLWMAGKSEVLSFSLIGKETLAQPDTGAKFIQILIHKCTGAGSVTAVLLAVLIIIYGILCMTVWRQKKPEIQMGNRYDYVFLQKPGIWNEFKPSDKKTLIRQVGILKGIHGEYAGQSLEIHPGEEIILGRDPQYCMLIFRNPGVSRRQCGIRYDAVNGYYQAIDYSSNGTILSDGTLLTTSEYTPLKPGTIIYIAGDSEALMLV